MKIFVLFAVLATAAASCENGCSGHGHCGLYDLCQCYGNWEGNDCSSRVCPYEKAWVDTAIAVDDAHNYARCANKGECDGKSGQCKCWEPFGGKGCRRMECPNDCSGHGTCEYISELAASNTCPWLPGSYAAKTDCIHASVSTTTTNEAGDAQSYGAKHAATQVPSIWDAWKIQGCQCDPGYEGADCSSRICPSGDDPLRHRTADDSATQANHKFNLLITTKDATAWEDEEGQTSTTGVQGMGPPTFVLAFTDSFNEKWITRPIPVGVTGRCDDEGTCPNEDRTGFVTTFAGTNTPLILSHNIRQALLDLPNGAVTGEDIDPRTGEKDSDALSVVCTKDGSSDYIATCVITMGSKHNSGDLSNKLECWVAGCVHVGASTTANPGGCSPKYSGLGADSSCVVTDTAGTSNYDTCSGRGACNGADGLCECFEGYTDEDCHVQTVLV
jgi:hypothetical protein